MRHSSLTNRFSKAAKNLFIAVLTLISLASFRGTDSSKPFIKIGNYETNKVIRSSKGSINMSKSVTVNRSIYEVHDLFVKSADKYDLLVTMPKASELLESSKEVDQNFTLSTMWNANNNAMQESMNEVNAQFEAENNTVIYINPCMVNSTNEVDEQFKAENRF